VSEQRPDLLATAPRLLVLSCLGDLARDIPRSLVHAACDLAVSCGSTVPLRRLSWANLPIAWALMALKVLRELGSLSFHLHFVVASDRFPTNLMSFRRS